MGIDLQVYENNYDVFEEVDATASRIAGDDYRLFTNLVRDLVRETNFFLKKIFFDEVNFFCRSRGIPLTWRRPGSSSGS